MKELRQTLIDAITDLADDEFETAESWKSLAKEDTNGLVERLIHIAEYYKNEYNEAI